MSLGIQARGRINHLNETGLKALIQSVGHHCGLSSSPDSPENCLTLQLTDNGSITTAWHTDDSGLDVSIESQTSVMGAGFHKLVAEYIDAVADLAGIEFDVEDDTDYFDDRDFEKLKKEHFEKWLGKVVTLLTEKHENYSNFMVNWDMAWPTPEDMPASVVMPFGRFSLRMINEIVEHGGTAALAETVFPCPDEEIDPDRTALFNALYMLWVKCFFMPSDRSEEDAEINSEIISLLEQVISSGKGLPIPHKEYLELCELAGHSAMDLTGVADYTSEYPIGFRRGLLTYRIGNVRFTIPGSMVYFEDEDSFGYWNCSEDDPVIRITAFNTKGSREFILSDNDIIISQGKIKHGDYVLTDSGKSEDSYNLQIQLVTEQQFTLFTITSTAGIGRDEAIARAEEFITRLTATKTDLDEEIKKLHDSDKHQDIVDLITALPADELTDELKSVLARAYNNLERYEDALKLLMEIKDTQENSPLWNFRAGYSYFYLGDYTNSLKYFRRELEMTPDDEDTKWFVAQCQVHNPFAKRVEDFWEWFRKHSDELSELLDRKDKGFERVSELINEGLDIIGGDVYYNIGGKNELTFCIENRTECLYLYPYLVESMPEDLRERWTVFPCKQPVEKADFIFGMYDKRINISEIMVGAVYNEETECLDITFYNPELSDLSEEDSTNAFCIILELMVGEGAVYNYLGEAKPAKNAKGLFPIGKLPAAMKYLIEENGQEYSSEHELPYYSYSCEPAENENRLRFDIMCGNTKFMALNREFVNDETLLYDRLISKGAEAMMLILTQPEAMSGEDFLAFRYKVEDRLKELFDAGIIKGQILGGAYGTMGTAYIDLLLYDGPGFTEYIGDDDNLDKLILGADGKACPTQVYVKDFTQGSNIFRIR